jgi:hypothetical protein
VLRYGVGTTEYMRSTGGYALTLECGQHARPAGAGSRLPRDHEYAGPPAADRRAGARAGPFDEMEALQMVVVHDKLDAGDSFSRTWASFDPVAGASRSARAPTARRCWPSSPAASCSRTRMRPNHEWYYLTFESDRPYDFQQAGQDENDPGHDSSLCGKVVPAREKRRDGRRASFSVTGPSPQMRKSPYYTKAAKLVQSL